MQIEVKEKCLSTAGKAQLSLGFFILHVLGHSIPEKKTPIYLMNESRQTL